MGARKKRQEKPCWHEQPQPIVDACKGSSFSPTVIIDHGQIGAFTNPERVGTPTEWEKVDSSSCCNIICYNKSSRGDQPPKQITDELTENILERSEILKSFQSRSPPFDSSTYFPNLFKYLSSVVSNNLFHCRLNNKYYSSDSVTLVRLFIFIIVASSSVFVPPVESVCVWQGGGGFRVACGFRQSGLFRIRSIGGIKGYVGAGFTIGDENGFKDSLTNTEPQQSGAYVIPNNVHSQRSLPGAHDGLMGQYSQIQEHALPIPTGDPASQHQQKVQYLDNIQNQMETDQHSLHQIAADQQTQKLLEHQLHMQGGMMPPAPTAKVKRAGNGGLTKRASLWNWPNIFRGKNGKNGNKKKPNHRNGPPPPASRRGGPPLKNKPHGKPGPPPPRRGERRKNGPPPPQFHPNPNNRPQRPSQASPSETFINPMQNPFAHLQDNFVGTHSQEARRMHNFQQGQERLNQKFSNNRNQFPPPPMPEGKNFFQQPAPYSSGQVSKYSGEGSGQVPQQLMMPPAAGPSPNIPVPLPKFKKIPNNKAPLTEDDYEDIPLTQQHFMDQQGPPTPSVDRMMLDADESQNGSPQQPSPTDFFNGPGGSLERQFNDYEADPAGLKMLKRTENFGQIFHLINPDGSPVNMQFEKQPIVPPGIELTSQQQQDLVEELASVLPHPNSADMGGGGDFMDSPLATAVYDPNIFPDIYFTTTEKHSSQQQHEFLNGGGAGGNSAGIGGYSISQELLDNPLLGNNQIKRILGIASAEKVASSEGNVQQFRGRKKAGAVLRSNEVSGDEQVVSKRRKMRRRKKFRMNQQMANQIDASDPEITGLDASAKPESTVLPKRRRKGRRKKKYKLHTMSPQKNNHEDEIASSTERMGLPATADGGELASSEMKTETPTPDPLTTTPVPQRNVVIVTPTSPVSSAVDNVKVDRSNENNGRGEKKTKTSFTLPSSEDVRPTSLEQLLLTGPSSENKIDTSAPVTSTKKTSEETTTTLPISYSAFGFNDALRNKLKNDQDADYDELSGPSGPGGYFRAGYDPRFPPDHEVNRGHNMTKFIRPRGKSSEGSTTPSSNDIKNGPFILYDMTGNRNHSRFSSKFHKETSPFRLEGDVAKSSEPNRVGNAYSQSPHPFYTNSNLHGKGQDTGNKGVFLKLDSREWANDRQKSHYEKDHSSDPFSKHYNRTSLTSSGYYGSVGSKEFRPSVEIPWDRVYNTPSTTTQSPKYARFGNSGSVEMKNSKFSKSSSSVEHGLFAPTMETFGLPRPASTPMAVSGEKQQRKLHQNLFGGSSADVSDMGNWASPNFWGNVQETDRYSPSVDFESNNNNNLKRLREFGDPNGLKEIKPVDLSSPTPIPMPTPSQSTMEDMMDGPGYFLSPSTPGERWGKQRKRKGRPTTVAPATPSPVPLIMSTVSSTAGTPSTTSSKWLAVLSNEVDLAPEYYDNMSMPPPGSASTSVEIELKKKHGKGKKKGVQIKLRSGEEQDPEEEQNENANVTGVASSHFDILNGYPAGASGYPGVMVHDFESSNGYSFGELGSVNNNSPPPPPPGFPHVHIPPPLGSDISYFPTVESENRGNDDNRYGNVQVSSDSSGAEVFPPMAQFGPPPSQNKNRKSNQGPIFPGRQDSNGRRDFVPSAEDLGPIPPLPPSSNNNNNAGLPSAPAHNDNPFKMFEKQNVPVNSGLGFVSTKNELKQMEDQISKFSSIPETFLRRDSSEKMMGGGHVHAPNMDESHHEFHGPPASPSSSEMNIPGFVTIPLPSIDQGHSHQQHPNEGNPSSYGPSGFPTNIRDPERTSLSGPPAGLEGEFHEANMPSGPPPGMMKDPHEGPWDYRPLEHNDVNEIGPPPPPPPHIMLTGGHPPLDSEEEFRRRPPHLREEPPRGPPPSHERPPHLRDGPSGPPPELREGPPGSQSHNGPPRPPPHLRDGPPQHHGHRDGPPGPPGHRDGPPPHIRNGPLGQRDSPPPHIRDGPPGHRNGPPPHIRDGPPGQRNGPPPHIRDGPPNHRDTPPPHMRDGPPSHRDSPPPHMRDGPPNHRDSPPPHIRDGPQGHRDEPPPHIRDGPPGHRNGPPPHIREGPPGHRDLPPGPPPHIRDGPPGPPHERPPHLRDGPGLLRPPPPLQDDRDRIQPHDRPPHLREEHPSMRPPPPMREDHPIRPPPLREEHPSRPPPRDDHHMRPPPPQREEHPSRPPPRDDHHMRPPPPQREEHPSRPPPRDDHHMRPPPPLREERPMSAPGRPHDFPPRGPPGGPPGHHELERRPQPGPPRHNPEDRFRDGPHQGPDSHKHSPRPNGPPEGFFPPPRDDHFDHDRNNFIDEHKKIEHMRPPPNDHRGDHSNFNSWKDEQNMNRGHPPPGVPPTPHGMPDFLDLQKVPKNKEQRPFKDHSPKSQVHNPFLQKYPQKKPLHPGNPTKIPPQVFKPPPPPSKSLSPGNFFSSILHPFGKHTSTKMHPPPPLLPPKPRQQQMPPPLHKPESRPQHLPNHPPPRKPPVPLPSKSDHMGPDPFAQIPFHETPHQPSREQLPNNPNNYINPFNDRYEPPAPQPPPRMEDPNHKLHLRPEPLPLFPPHGQDQAGSRIPFLPFPGGPGGSSFESSVVDLDQNPHAHLLPPKFMSQPPHDDPSTPIRHLHEQHTPPKQTPRPVYQPKPTKPQAKIDEKSKVLEAFETLNKANYDVIQSVAADQYGQKFIDKIKTKTNIIKDDSPAYLPPVIVTTSTTPQPPLMSMMTAFNTKKQAAHDENTKLAELLKMINNKSNPSAPTHMQPIASASTMGAQSSSGGDSVDPLASLLQKFAKPIATTPPTTTTTTQRVIPELPSNPGLVSLTSLNHGSTHDIKSLQAQIAKAIIAKAHRKSQHEQLDKPHYQPVQINAPTNESPLAVLQQLAQNRQATIEQQASSKNYTASQIETLKKLIALNNLEQKIQPSPSPAQPEDPLKKLQALLPAALKAAKQQQQQQPDSLPSNTITRKMLDSTTANSLAHQNNHLQSPDPTILALKAIAMSKSQGINPQPSISFPQQVKPTEPSSQPIAVDLSAILSPSPPAFEASRKRRLTNVRNAPKSFYPANATQGFEDFSGPLMTEFHCDEQSFFPGLYADTELGCRVFHLCAKTEAGYMMKSFRCPKETVFDQEVLRCNWNLFVECPSSKNKYHFNKYLSQSFQFLKILGEFSANSQKG